MTLDIRQRRCSNCNRVHNSTALCYYDMSEANIDLHRVIIQLFCYCTVALIDRFRDINTMLTQKHLSLNKFIPVKAGLNNSE